MRWSDEALQTFSNHVVALGLSTCPVCDGEALVGLRQPVIVSLGGTAWDERLSDGATNIVYLFVVECQVCGHHVNFNSERILDGDTPVLQREP